MMKDFGHICIEQVSEQGVGGGEYFKDIQKERAEELIGKIKQLAKDFILANDCQVDLVDHQDKSGFGFYIINKQGLGLINVYYEILYQSEEFSKSDFRQTFEKILSGFFQIDNPVGLLEKVSKEEDTDFFKMTIEGKLY